MYSPTTAPALRLFCSRESETGYFVSLAHYPRYKSSHAVGDTEINTPGAAPCCGVVVCSAGWGCAMCPYSPPYISRACHQTALGQQAATAPQRWQFMSNACFWGGPWLLTPFYPQGLPKEELAILLASRSWRLSEVHVVLRNPSLCRAASSAEGWVPAWEGREVFGLLSGCSQSFRLTVGILSPACMQTASVTIPQSLSLHQPGMNYPKNAGEGRTWSTVLLPSTCCVLFNQLNLLWWDAWHPCLCWVCCPEFPPIHSSMGNSPLFVFNDLQVTNSKQEGSGNFYSQK